MSLPRCDGFPGYHSASALSDEAAAQAHALLERLFEVTSSDERRGYTLEVRVSNEGAIKLYERLGFVARGVRRGYYTDNREDALIMWRDPVPDQKAEAEQAEAG